MNTYVLGSSGQIGQELLTFFGKDSKKVSREVYSNWITSKSIPEINTYFKQSGVNGDSLIFIACGLLNPNCSSKELMESNFHIPKNVISALDQINPKIVTFGSIQEKLQLHPNRYISSKNELADFVSSEIRKGKNLFHLRLHTIFGNHKPKEFMFLGQMLNSIINNHDFHMSSGRQLREYHHVVDEVIAVDSILKSKQSGIFDINSGQALTLKQIAEYIFENFKKSELLKVGVLEDPIGENYSEKLYPDQYISENHFRDTLPAIVSYLEKFITT